MTAKRREEARPPGGLSGEWSGLDWLKWRRDRDVWEVRLKGTTELLGGGPAVGGAELCSVISKDLAGQRPFVDHTLVLVP